MPIPVIIGLSGPPFTFEMKQPPVSFFLKKAANLKIARSSRLQDARPQFVGKVTMAQIAKSPRRNGRSELRQHRIGDVDDRRFRPRYGPRGGGVSRWLTESVSPSPREGIERTKLYPVDQAVKLVRERARPSSTDRRDRHEPRRRPQARRPDGPRRGQPAERHRPHALRVAVFARAEADEARPPAPTSSARTTLVAEVQGGRWSSTAASPPRT